MTAKLYAALAAAQGEMRQPATSILAWHFVGATLRDGRPVPLDGEWLVHDGEVMLCKSGLHASRDPFDALQYAPGNVLCRVELAGDIVEGADKLAATRRRIIARVDFEPQLRAFARRQALTVLHLWDAPEVVRRYLETGDESLRAAAWAAARAAARAERAAWAAADAASASTAAAMAASAAAWAKWAKWAEGAEGAAAWNAALDAQREEFSRLVSEVFAGEAQ